MKKMIENVKFMLDGTMVFGDLHLEDGFVERIDYKTPHMSSNIVIPGLIDIHTHGFRSYSCDELDPKRLKEMVLEYSKRGITSFCPTISSRSLKEYEDVIKVYRSLFQGDVHGAQFEGFHLEGPYLNPAQCGAQNIDNIYDIHLGELEEFLSKYHNDIKIMTIAPEVKHAQEAIQLLNLYGVRVSLGHTNATFQQSKDAFEAGATQITHFGNTMPMISHHEETMADAIFLSDCTCEIIMDRIHMQKEMMKWVIKLLGTQRIIAISDGSKYTGYAKDEKFELEDGITLSNHAIYKKEKMLGSCCDMLDIFQYLYREAQYDLIDCVQMCSTNAAKILKSYTAEIGLGKKVDLVVLNPDLEIIDVIINGKSAI